MTKAQINEILDKEVDRKEFLKHIGIAIVAVAGVPTLVSHLNTLQNRGSSGAAGSQGGARGYGASAYGR